MSIYKVLRFTTLAVSLIAVTAGMSSAFAATNSAPLPQQKPRLVNSGIYDSPDFVASLADTY